jgi:hypothetical protein
MQALLMTGNHMGVSKLKWNKTIIFVSRKKGFKVKPISLNLRKLNGGHYIQASVLEVLY